MFVLGEGYERSGVLAIKEGGKRVKESVSVFNRRGWSSKERK